jgi:hypothetical protein
MQKQPRRSSLKILSKNEFVKAAGMPVTHNRDFSLYDGAPYDCVCGNAHTFNQFSGQHFASSGVSAKFVVQCPDNPNAATLIKTKNKFLIFFARFVSLAGCVVEK